VLLLATAQWEWAVQLGLTAIFGLFTGITLGVDYLALVLTNCLASSLSFTLNAWLLTNHFTRTNQPTNQQYAFICVFNLLALLGRLPFLGFEHSLYDLYDSHPAHCHEWFNLSHHHASSLCYGYVSFSRVLAYLMVWLVAAQAFVSYYLYKERSLECTTRHDTHRTRHTPHTRI